MDVATFFSRLLQPPKESHRNRDEDDIRDFDEAWTTIKDILEQPNERQIIKGIHSTEVPGRLQHIVDALVYEANRMDEDTTGACLEYFFKNDLLAHLERLCENDRPHGIKVEVVKFINNLVVLLSERFLVHNAVHRPLRRLLRSCIGGEQEDKVDGNARVFGAASYAMAREDSEEEDVLEGDLVDLMCVLCSRMRAYPPLLLIFFHDKGWLQPHTSSGAPPMDHSRLPTSSLDGNGPIRPAPTTDRATSHFEFLLFSYLLRFAHREGRVGDLARAGLLFLFDIAFLTPSEEGGENLHITDLNGEDPLQESRNALGEFILDGDFADVICAGIGAIYSILPTKLRIPSLADQAVIEETMTASTSGGMHLGGGHAGSLHPSNLDLNVDLALPSTSDVMVRDKIDLLLKLFGFLQDIVFRCNAPLAHASPDTSAVEAAHILGPAICEASLDAIRSSFIETIIYPSILESSPSDGSSVAVMTYIDVLLANLDEGPLLTTLLDALLDSNDSAAPRKKGARNQSTDALKTEYFVDEGRFTLKDLLLDNLRSTDWTSSTTAFRLLQTLLGDHCRQTVSQLLTIVRDPAATTLARRPIPGAPSSDPFLSNAVSDTFLPSPVNSVDVHLQEVELYGSLISRIDPLQTSTELTAGYAGYLVDINNALQADPCLTISLNPLSFGEDEEKPLVHVGRFDDEPNQHRLNPNDPMIKSIFSSFGAFFCQMPDVNVALTGTLAALALCPNRSLAGWLLYDVKRDADPWWKTRARGITDENDAASDVSEDDLIARKFESGDHGDGGDLFAPSRNNLDLPALYQIFRDLVRQVNRFRLDIQDFDRLLAERRQGLLFADHLDEAMNIMLDVEPTAFGLPSAALSSSVASPVPKRPKAGPLSGGLGGALKSFLTPKRKTSPLNYTPGHGGTPSSLREAASRINASPFRTHYEATSLLTLETSTSPGIASGPWSPGRGPVTPDGSGSRPRSSLGRMTNATWDDSGPNDNNNVPRLSPSPGAEHASPSRTRVTLSSVLDNCVILEEFLKEIVAVITARRALGVDQVGFV
ncbi:Retinoic acid induced 16-like protein-domain-containing protein [Kockovaella imperatae]|uniref:Retinoic acid induced 16-like protein-domain-containing protein n=1 Tax=Kockovaella imperatae TaxID=4999 RepID=A0A1Y1UQ01_9TREE|nr:Retinoic acid induced 16-like protein-domain-containing protein [Kockovaella imperatae]ORX40138.1 Retinoic acid induced 16-like protein-domain-containing protein [Kockovaella imperatae]